MEWITDAFFTIGSGHTICQDYALAVENRIIVCDGCSTAPHTDVGARLIAHNLVHWLRGPKARGDTHPHNHAMIDASGLARILVLPEQSLYATILSTEITDDGMSIDISGDGVIGILFNDGSVSVLDAFYESGAPYYRAYDYSPNKEQYQVEFPGEYKIRIGENNGYIVPQIDAPFVLNPNAWYNAPIRAILLGSDGLKTLGIPVQDVVEQLFAVKNPVGEFAQRRARRILSDYAKDGKRPYDDFSVAMMWRKP